MNGKDVCKIVGYSKGISKKGDRFTKIAVEFVSPYKDFQGVDVASHFIYDDCDVEVGMEIYLDYGRKANGMAYVRGFTPAV